MAAGKELSFFVAVAVALIISGCSCCGPFPADGIHSTGGLLNPCDANCMENADFIETLKHYTPEEIKKILESGGELQGYRAKRYP